MANEEHLNILKQGVEVWNQWKRNNPGVILDLNETDMSWANLRQADLSDADLSRANLSKRAAIT